MMQNIFLILKFVKLDDIFFLHDKSPDISYSISCGGLDDLYSYGKSVD